MAKRDLTGMRFSRLVVLCDDGTRDKRKNIMWKCQCDCGNIKHVRTYDLTNKKHPVRSCGCLQKETVKEMWKDEEYRKMQSERAKKIWRDEDFRQMKSNEMKEMWQDEEFIQMQTDKMRELNKKQWSNEELRQVQRNKMIELNKKQWNDEEFKQMQRDKMTEQWQNEEMKWKMGYKGGITPISIYLRNKNEEWFNKCKQEANYTCQLTGKYRGVNTHHLYAFSSIVLDAHNTYNIEIKEQVKDYTDKELELLEQYVAEWHKDNSNAIVLCEEAHTLFHNLYGKGSNTPEQFEEFRERYLNGEFKDLLGDVLTVTNKL